MFQQQPVRVSPNIPPAVNFLYQLLQVKAVTLPMIVGVSVQSISLLVLIHQSVGLFVCVYTAVGSASQCHASSLGFEHYDYVPSITPKYIGEGHCLLSLTLQLPDIALFCIASFALSLLAFACFCWFADGPETPTTYLGYPGGYPSFYDNSMAAAFFSAPGYGGYFYGSAAYMPVDANILKDYVRRQM